MGLGPDGSGSVWSELEEPWPGADSEEAEDVELELDELELDELELDGSEADGGLALPDIG